MVSLQDRRLEQDVMLRQIEDVLRRGHREDRPAYTLVFGAGASFGAVPTTKQMLGIPDEGRVHEHCIPAFLRERRHGQAPTPEQLPEIVRDFWGTFLTANHNLAITLNAQNLPDNASIAAAYKGIFDHSRTSGLNTPAEAREYLRTIMLRHQDGSILLNGTHFFLASLLSLQRRRGAKAEDGQPLYVGQRDFTRTIFTTNFDPLLQVSLQLFQLLYYMTDRPELLAADSLHTDAHPALHLFYAHGSVHRPFLANTEYEINQLHTNARDLAGYFSQHGVIVLGSAGWDDCILRALQQAPSFANNLYWLARGDSSISPEIRNFLCSRSNTFWVPIGNGDEFMAALHRHLCPGMPLTELLHNPIPVLQRGLDRVKLSDIQAPIAAATSRAGSSLTVEQFSSPEQLRSQVVELLNDSTRYFVDRTRLKPLEHQADIAYAEEKWSTVIALYSEILDHQHAPLALRAHAFFRRGTAHSRENRPDDAIASYSQAIELQSAPAKTIAIALVNRGVCYAKQGKDGKAVADWIQVVQLPNAPAESVAGALFNRGVFYEQQDKTEAIAYYTQAISLPDAPATTVAMALLNRGACHSHQGRRPEAIADYTAAISLPHARAEDVAAALANRGLCHGQQNEKAKELDDYTQAIHIPGAHAKGVAAALINRGIYYERQGKNDEAIIDYTEAINLSGIPVESMAIALVNRSDLYGLRGEYAKAIADCSQAINLSGAPAEMIARAHYGRGLSLNRVGKTAAARVDLDIALLIPDLPEELARLARAALTQFSGPAEKFPHENS